MTLGRLRHLGANFLGFQATWFACVGGAGAGWPWLGPAAALLWLSLHLMRLHGNAHYPRGQTGSRTIELRLVLAAVCVGYALDGALALGGAIAFPAQAGPAAPTTPWMVALWAAFAATLRHSMNWLRRRYILGAAAGAAFGPIAYRTGEALGAISVAAGPTAWIAVAGAWALAMPMLLGLRERLEKPARS